VARLEVVATKLEALESGGARLDERRRQLAQDYANAKR